MNLLEIIAANQITKTGETKKLSVPGQFNNGIYDVYAIPLEYLYFNDDNGRINTAYQKYKAENGSLIPETGESQYNLIFEEFIYNSNKIALKNTLKSIKERGQHESGVVLPDGRVIDGNRRLTALRKLQRSDGIPKNFNAVVLKLDPNIKNQKKIIKQLELDLQLGHEEKINYDPIDRIFDVHNTIVVEQIMTIEEYKKYSGAGNTRGINRDLKLAELIIRFIKMISPGGNPIAQFYLVRDLQLDGPFKEIDSTINKLKSNHKEAITDAVLVTMAVSKTDIEKKEPKLVMRHLKDNILNNPEILDYYIDAVDSKVDIIIDAFEENPIQSSNDLNLLFHENEELNLVAEKLVQSTNRLINKGSIDKKRTRVLVELENIFESLMEIDADDFEELKEDEYFKAKDVLIDISDVLYKLRKKLNL